MSRPLNPDPAVYCCNLPDCVSWLRFQCAALFAVCDCDHWRSLPKCLKQP